tara:strand:+ start:296 stop:583 length:288 start_codon:yes stop_codon:yes gene_type:complete
VATPEEDHERQVEGLVHSMLRLEQDIGPGAERLRARIALADGLCSACFRIWRRVTGGAVHRMYHDQPDEASLRDAWWAVVGLNRDGTTPPAIDGS